jgi:hypothetical protein
LNAGRGGVLDTLQLPVVIVVVLVIVVVVVGALLHPSPTRKDPGVRLEQLHELGRVVPQLPRLGNVTQVG